MVRWCSKIEDPPKLPQDISAILQCKFLFCPYGYHWYHDRLRSTGDHRRSTWSPISLPSMPLWIPMATAGWDSPVFFCRLGMRYQLSSHPSDGFSIHWYHLWQSQPWIHHPGWLKSDFEAKNSSLAHWVIHWNSLGIHSDSQGFSCTPTVEQLGRSDCFCLLGSVPVVSGYVPIVTVMLQL